MTQNPFAAKNSDNGCLRGIEGMPSHSTISFCFFLGRKGGRNSTTISFLNLVRNMTPHCKEVSFECAYGKLLDGISGTQTAWVYSHWCIPVLWCGDGRDKALFRCSNNINHFLRHLQFSLRFLTWIVLLVYAVTPASASSVVPVSKTCPSVRHTVVRLFKSEQFFQMN